MKNQSVRSILVLGLIASTATPSFSQITSKEDLTVKCEAVNGVPTTVVLYSQRSQPIFHWNQKDLPVSVNANNLCQDVSSRLQTFVNSSDRSQLPALSFTTDLKLGIPTVCLGTASGKCKEVLFTLSAMSDKTKPALYEVNNVLFNIIDDSFKVTDATPVREGFVSARYPLKRTRLFPW